jgi:tRNA-dihydrouridine synthase
MKARIPVTSIDERLDDRAADARFERRVRTIRVKPLRAPRATLQDGATGDVVKEIQGKVDVPVLGNSDVRT